MDYLLALHRLIFFIPLAFGMLLVIGAALGLGHGDPEADVDHDISHDVGHDAGHGHGHDGHEHSFLVRVFSLFGVGRVPLTIIMMLVCFIWSLTGIVMNAFLAPLIEVSGLFALISVGAAGFCTLAFTGVTARLVARIMPTTETYRVSKHDLTGMTGELVLPANATAGTAQVTDPRGNVHNISCRSTKGELKEGEGILVIDYDESADVYTVERYSPNDETGAGAPSQDEKIIS